MLASALALLLGFAPPEGSAPEDAPEDAPEPGADAPTSSPDEPELEPHELEPGELEPGKLVLVPSRPGRYRIVASDESFAQTVEASPEQPAVVALPAGIYYVHDESGGVAALLVSVAGRAQVWDGERVIPAEAWAAERAERAEREARAQQQVITPPVVTAPSKPQRNHKAWAAPLSSALLPGGGQFVNGQGGKGTGILFGTLGAVAGSVVLYRLDNDGRRSLGAEYARLIGYGVLSSAASMLWIYAIADAYRVAVGDTVEPARDHKVRFSVNRTMTVGFRADPRRPGFYDDWSVALMGQAARRLTVGVSDLSFEIGRGEAPQVWQFGARVDYRVYEHPRLWIDLGFGTAMQVASVRSAAPLDPDAPAPDAELRFGAIPYGYLDLRCFVLDRLSLDFTPRLSVPVTTRWFSANRALPRFAPSLELGVGVSAYF